MPYFKRLPAQAPLSPVSTTYAATALALSQAVALEVQCLLDVKYGSSPENKLDIYLPGETDSACPVYIGIHGGNWSHGFKEWFGLGAGCLTRGKAIFVSIDYRLSGSAKFPAALDDCMLAISWVKQHISTLGGDPERIFIGGHSAGATLAALSVLRRDRHDQFGLRENDIKGCFPFSGVYDFRKNQGYPATPTDASIDAFLPSASDADAASPICHVEGNTTPFFVSSSEYDFPLMRAQAMPFFTALNAEQGRVENHTFAGFDHFHIHLDQVRDQNLFNVTLLNWMRESQH
jgi:arylformamidase